jgi:hypothetical protein
VELPPFPSFEGLRARLTATHEWAQRLSELEPSRAARLLFSLTLRDLGDAERLLSQPEASDKPHILRAVEVCLDVAQWRLRGIEQIIEDVAEPTRNRARTNTK